MLDYTLDINGNVIVDGCNAKILAEQPAKQSKVTAKNHIIGFERPDGIRVKYDRQSGLMVTYKIINEKIYVMSCSVEKQVIYENLHDATFYKRLDNE